MDPVGLSKISVSLSLRSNLSKRVHTASSLTNWRKASLHRLATRYLFDTRGYHRHHQAEVTTRGSCPIALMSSHLLRSNWLYTMPRKVEPLLSVPTNKVPVAVLQITTRNKTQREQILLHTSEVYNRSAIDKTPAAQRTYNFINERIIDR